MHGGCHHPQNFPAGPAREDTRLYIPGEGGLNCRPENDTIPAE